MKTRELRQKSIGEIEGLLREKQGEILEAHFGLQSGQKKKVHVVRAARKDIAKIFTIFREQNMRERR